MTVLATLPRDGAPPHASKAAISRGEGEGAVKDGVLTPPNEPTKATTEPFKIVRASTRFEIRIRPEGEGLELLKALDAISSDIARARNAAMRANFVADGAWLDAHPEVLEAWRRGDKKLEWWGDRAKRRHAEKNPNGVYSYPRMRAASPNVDPVIIAALQNLDDATWIGDRFDVLVRMSRAPRHYKSHQPIPVPHARVKLTVEPNGAATVDLKLQAGDAPHIKIRVVARDAWQRDELKNLCDQSWRLGQVVISRHPKKRGRWFLRFAYTRLVERAEGTQTVVVRRGMRSFLVAASSSGSCRPLYDGGDILNFKRQMDARRRSLGAHTKAGTMGSGGTGHGTGRRILALKDLSDKEARFCKSVTQRAAAALVAFARAEGACEVVFEDFAAPKGENVFWLVARWPWYQLNEACQSACEAAGIPARAVIVKVDRKVCPSCEHTHQEAPVSIDRGDRVWECMRCGMKRSPDQVDALDMLRTVVGGEAVSRTEARRKAATRSLASGPVAEKPPSALEAGKDVKPKEKTKRGRKVGSGRNGR